MKRVDLMTGYVRPPSTDRVAGRILLLKLWAAGRRCPKPYEPDLSQVSPLRDKSDHISRR
jgi:hypothetical protein